MNYILTKGKVVHFETKDRLEMVKAYQDANKGYLSSGKRPEVEPRIWKEIDLMNL